MHRRPPVITLVLAFAWSLAPVCAYAEDWPGYEKDNRHHNSSAVDVDPDGLLEAWRFSFANLSVCYTSAGNEGFHGSRNLTLVGGNLAVIARPADTTGPGGQPYVTVLDAASGDVVTCIRTDLDVGPRRDQFMGYGSVYMEAYDTGIGIAVTSWDPTTGIFYLCNGGDGADQAAYKLLDNVAAFDASKSSGAWYVDGVPAFESIRTNHPDLQDCQGRTVADLAAEPYSDYSPSAWLYNGAVGANQTAFFEVPLDGDYIVKPGSQDHIQGSSYLIVNKTTGLGAKLRNGLVDMGSIDTPAYTPGLTYSDWCTFKMWGGCMTTNGKVYFMGPGDDCDGTAFLGDGSLFSAGLVRDQGLYIGCLSFSYSDLKSNDGYSGPGTAETAANGSPLWKYRYVSSAVPADLNDADSYLEQDGFYRNKAWFLDGDTVWAAWKPSRAGSMQLIHCGPAVNETFDLGIGAGQRGQDIWPHISFVDLGASEKYVVYYAGNAWHKTHTGVSSHTGWDTSSTGDEPLGPAAISVFDADAGTHRWTYVLNAADSSGPYSSLPRNEATGYFDRSQMVVAGSHAYVSWVDLSGTDATLAVVGFDITGPQPTSAPVPFTTGLGVPSASSRKTFVTDLIAVDGALYALVTVSDVMDTCTHTWTSQVVVALEPSGIAPNAPPVATTQNTVALQGAAVSVLLAASDPDGDPLTYAVASPPASGTLSGAAPAIEYTSNPAFEGTDTFTFTADDGQVTSSAATVSVVVLAPGGDYDLDAVTNADELAGTTDPLDADTDDDGLDDGDEITFGTDPVVPDSDSDGYSDGQEAAAGTDPTDPADFPVVVSAGASGLSCAAGESDAVLAVIAAAAAAWAALRGRRNDASTRSSP